MTNSRFWFLHPATLFWSVRVFLHDWWFSRKFSTLLGGMPATLVPVAALVLVTVGATTDEATLTRRYAEARETAAEREDFETAQICLRKLAVLEPDNLQHRFMQGIVAARNEDLPQARRIMHRLAPLDATGYAPAHVWIAVDMVQSTESPQAKHFQAAKQHLLRAVTSQPRHVKAHALLAQLYLTESNPQRAAAHLAQVVDRMPTKRMQLARLYQRTGEKRRATEQAQLAFTFFREVLDQDSTRLVARIQLADSLMFQEQFDESVAVLREGLVQVKDNRLRRALARVYAVWSDRTPAEQARRRFELLQRAIALAPNDPQIVQRLAAVAGKDGPNREEVRSHLHELLAQGNARLIAHFILGTMAIEENDTQNGLLHLEQAHELNPRMAAVANNLAWVLTQTQPPQLDRALKLADTALEFAPRHPELRETRGVVHFRLEHWKQAIADLEVALRAFPKRKALHEHLALAYERVGDEKLAAVHREFLEEAPGEAEPPAKPE